MMVNEMKAYLRSDQSRPVGQSNAPVRSWLKPRPHLLLRLRYGLIFSSPGAIQSTIATFMVLVSSARDPLAPFCIYKAGEEAKVFHFNWLTRSAMSSTSSLDASSNLCSRPQHSFKSCRKTSCSRFSLDGIGSRVWFMKKLPLTFL